MCTFKTEVYGTPVVVYITEYVEAIPDTFHEQGNPEELYFEVLTLEGKKTGITEDTLTGDDYAEVYEACKKYIEENYTDYSLCPF